MGGRRAKLNEKTKEEPKEDEDEAFVFFSVAPFSFFLFHALCLFFFCSFSVVFACSVPLFREASEDKTPLPVFLLV